MACNFYCHKQDLNYLSQLLCGIITSDSLKYQCILFNLKLIPEVYDIFFNIWAKLLFFVISDNLEKQIRLKWSNCE